MNFNMDLNKHNDKYLDKNNELKISKQKSQSKTTGATTVNANHAK